MSGGHADNVTPQSCDLLLDRRLISQESELDVREQIDNLLRRAASEHGIEAAIVSYMPTTGGATETDPRNPVVQAAVAAARANGVTNLQPYGLQGACDLVHCVRPAPKASSWVLAV